MVLLISLAGCGSTATPSLAPAYTDDDLVAVRQAIGGITNKVCRQQQLWRTWVGKTIEIDVARHREDVAFDVGKVLQAAREIQATPGGTLLEPDLGRSLGVLEGIQQDLSQPMTQGEFDRALATLSKLELILCLGSPGEELLVEGVEEVTSIALRELLIKIWLDENVER
jgi:hypothetical protein